MASATEMSNFELFLVLFLDDFSAVFEELEADDVLLVFEDVDDFEVLDVLRFDETATLSESVGIVCLGPDW